MTVSWGLAGHAGVETVTVSPTVATRRACCPGIAGRSASVPPSAARGASGATAAVVVIMALRLAVVLVAVVVLACLGLDDMNSSRRRVLLKTSDLSLQ